MDGGDFRMIELGERRRFGAKALHEIAVLEARVEDLDGYLAVERLVDGPEDRTHAAAAQLVDDPILPDGFPDHERLAATNTFGG